jgi:hypothetical protein
MRPDPEEDAEDQTDEQDLLVVLRLSNRMMGTARERMDLEAFAEELGAAVAEAGVGEYDGDELGAGECLLFFCGPDVEQLQAVLSPLLKRSPLARGAHFVRMVEGPDGHSQQQRVPL